MPNLELYGKKSHVPQYLYQKRVHHIHINYGVCMYHMDVSENNGTPKSSILIGFSIINHPFWGTLILGNTYIFVVLSLFLIHLHPFLLNEEIPQVSNHTFESRYQCQRPIQVHASPAWASFPWDDFPSKFARIFSMKNCEKL